MEEVPSQFSSVIGMGTVQAIYQARKVNKWIGLVIGLLSLAGFGLMLLITAYSTYEQVAKYGAAVLVKTATPLMVISCILFIIAVVALWSAFINWNKALVFYQHGFAYNDRKGVQTWRWEDVLNFKAAVTRHYTNGIYTGTTHVYSIEGRDGQKFVMGDVINKIEEAADRIRSGIFPGLYSRYAQVYNSGQLLHFGPVTLSKVNGIQIGKKVYPWDQVAQVSIRQGYVQVGKQGGGWFSGASAAAATIPNLEVFLSIINQVVGVKAS